ncbi:MAG: DNA phosphorothioation system sulfurtransferase DndC [Magnetococcales bacterium]|nr:DNA phosphorothioation system sulfurtransferase DndC [Magnetococcales bacterium]MBF0114662.1 DNA phosphorothioation system sulfurtransferase DndC [Magnetococcales bacterium]
MFLELDDIAAKTISSLHSLYKRDDRPWVVAFSGGKDSTLLAQLVCSMLMERGAQNSKPVFIISSDTRVEAPNIEEYLAGAMQRMQTFAQHSRLPLFVQLVQPEADEGFWGQLIGKGYPSPTRWFRWCTSKMKIRPMRRAIEAITAHYGSVILLLGTRISESPERAKRMQGRDRTDAGLNPHDEIPNALVATPLMDWPTDTVWEYLLAHEPPWGGEQRTLYDLYRQAEGGECPVILDLNQPSCGGSRFGCWTCTVVKLDKSMQGFIDSGEEWMRPLNVFRDRLKAVRELPEWRMERRRSGALTEGRKGPFTPEKRKQLLRELLELEITCKKSLITDAELGYIQSVWSQEFDLSGCAALQLALHFGRNPMRWEGSMSLDIHDEVLEELLVDSALDVELVQRLLQLAYEYHPNLDIYGKKTEFERSIQEAIELAMSLSKDL